MEAVILIGLQAAGKTAFYLERYFGTHVHISLDVLKTRYRESRILQVCLDTQQPFVIDNTNPSALERTRYLSAAKHAKFRIVGYYFASRLEDCQARNEIRTRSVPAIGLLATAKKLERPTVAEGFDELRYVRLDESGFVVEEWKDAL